MKNIRKTHKKLQLQKLIISDLSKAQMQQIYGGAFTGTSDPGGILGGPQGVPPVKFTSVRSCASGYDGGCGSSVC